MSTLPSLDILVSASEKSGSRFFLVAGRFSFKGDIIRGGW